MVPHSFLLRVYYEDTDLAGVVYYANYLKFIERARSEWVGTLGVNQSRLRAEQGLVFAVRRVEADYLSPARFEDALVVETTLHGHSGARLFLDQVVLRGQDVLRGRETLFAARVTLVCLTTSGKAVRLPAALTSALEF